MSQVPPGPSALLRKNPCSTTLGDGSLPPAWYAVVPRHWIYGFQISHSCGSTVADGHPPGLGNGITPNPRGKTPGVRGNGGIRHSGNCCDTRKRPRLGCGWMNRRYPSSQRWTGRRLRPPLRRRTDEKEGGASWRGTKGNHPPLVVQGPRPVQEGSMRVLCCVPADYEGSTYNSQRNLIFSSTLGGSTSDKCRRIDHERADGCIPIGQLGGGTLPVVVKLPGKGTRLESLDQR